MSWFKSVSEWFSKLTKKKTEVVAEQQPSQLVEDKVLGKIVSIKVELSKANDKHKASEATVKAKLLKEKANGKVQTKGRKTTKEVVEELSRKRSYVRKDANQRYV